MAGGSTWDSVSDASCVEGSGDCDHCELNENEVTLEQYDCVSLPCPFGAARCSWVQNGRQTKGTVSVCDTNWSSLCP